VSQRPSAPPSPADSLAASTPPRAPRTDNLAALEMGGRVAFLSRDVGDWSRIHLLDGNPASLWLAGAPLPQEVVISFLNFDSALVSGVTLSTPARGPIPTTDKPNEPAWPKDVEISVSMESPTAGFRKVAAATLPQEPGDHEVKFASPVEGRYVKVAILSNYGWQYATVLADVAVHEAQAPGYVPFLTRHADLGALLSTGALPNDGSAASLPAVPAAAAPDDSCLMPARPDVRPTRPESRSVLVVGREAEGSYGPFYYVKNEPASPPIKYFPGDPGDGRVDSSIFQRAAFWPVMPEAVTPAALVPSAGVDTVVLSQLCDIKTKVSDGFKRALIKWVAAGHKLIIQDADGCGENNRPDYSFLPFPFATSNPGAQGAASALRLIEKNFLASTDPADPAFLDLDSWTRKTNGNPQNDFGDSNTVIKYDPNWCGAIVGTNVKGASGFVLVYAHYGAGVIVYDGVDHDQIRNVAYRQYVARQLLLPFAPDSLPCSTRLAPFAIATEAPLVNRDVLPGQTYTYPVSVLPIQPGYSGTVRLSLATPPALGGLSARFDPDTVSLGKEAKSTLTVTMPARLPEPWKMALRGAAGGVNAALCLAAHERRTGRLSVSADLGPRPAAAARKNLLIILDLSGSMNLPLGRSTRIATARQVLRDVLKRIPDDFNVGLRLYGHRYGSRQKETCTDSELKVPVAPLNRDDILKIVDSTRPRGETPLVYSVLQAIGDLKSAGGGSVALITDGEESCGGDFAAARNAIRASGLDFRLSIVGFTLKEQQAQQQLGALTAATGGAYYSASDGPSLTRALVAATISRFPYTVFDRAGAIVARGEAGDPGQELTAGDYKVIVQAGDEQLVLDNVSIAVAGGASVRVTRKGDRFALER
jgi:hypothetical protein